METFKEWMDARRMTAEEASEVFAKSPGTIRNWRSIGVPDSQREWVLKKMAGIDATRDQRPTPERVSLEITREEFAAWNRAALLEGKIIYDWAADVLNDAADSIESHAAPDPIKPLAPDPPDAGTAQPGQPSPGGKKSRTA